MDNYEYEITTNIDKDPQWDFQKLLLEQEQTMRKGFRKTMILTVSMICISFVAIIGIFFATNPELFGAVQNEQQSNGSSLLQAEQLNASSTPGDGNVISAVEKATDSIVEIVTETRQFNPYASQFVTEGAGSGVILTTDGYVITNKHVVDSASSITVRLQDGSEHKAELIGTDEKTDLAVLKINANGLTPATFADSDTIQVGQVALAIGNPLGELGGTVTDGIISAKDRAITIDGQTMTLLQTSAAVNPGNSGGGLFDSSGNLIGVVNAKTSGTNIEGLAFAIPSNIVSSIANELIENGYISGRPQLGIKVYQQSGYYSPTQNGYAGGVYIAELLVDSGLQVNDQIISVDGKEIASTTDISLALDQHSVGDIVEVVVNRNNERITVSVKLTEKTPDTTPTQLS